MKFGFSNRLFYCLRWLKKINRALALGSIQTPNEHSLAYHFLFFSGDLNLIRKWYQYVYCIHRKGWKMLINPNDKKVNHNKSLIQMLHWCSVFSLSDNFICILNGFFRSLPGWNKTSTRMAKHKWTIIIMISLFGSRENANKRYELQFKIEHQFNWWRMMFW